MKRHDNQDYQKYTDQQISRSDHKWGEMSFDRNWADFERVTKDVWGITGNLGKIICMGVRNGNEYFGFKKIDGFKKSEMWGVEINEKIKDVKEPNMFCMDFNKMPDEWANKFDMVYSNSLDHAFDVKATIMEWHKILRDDGFMYLSLSSSGHTSPADMYNFSPKDLAELFPSDKFKLVKVWEEQLPNLKTMFPQFYVLLKALK